MEKDTDASCTKREDGSHPARSDINTDISSDAGVRKSGFERIRQRIWEINRSITFRLSPWFAKEWRRFVISFVSGHKGYSQGCTLSRTCRIDYPWNVCIGAHTAVGERVWIQGQDRIVIGSDVCIEDEARIIAGSHDIASRKFDLKTKPIAIGDKSWIATGAIVLQGVSIGEGAVVSAGAVVSKDVAPWTVVAGNPAIEIGKREITEVGNV